MLYIIPQKPITSFVIRTKNEEKWLPTVLNKLFEQTRGDFEVIIVDSGSTDKTLEILKKFPIQKLIKIPEKDFNFSYALNLGIKESKGKYIGIISGHSVPISITWYEDVMKNFGDSKVAGISGYYTSLPDGSVDEKVGNLLSVIGAFKYKKNDKWLTNTNSIIRKDLWKIYPFDERIWGCEDYDWALEMMSRGYRIVKDPKFNVFHSHGGLGRPTYKQMVPRWKVLIAEIDKKQRPRKSFSKVV